MDLRLLCWPRSNIRICLVLTVVVLMAAFVRVPNNLEEMPAEKYVIELLPAGLALCEFRVSQQGTLQRRQHRSLVQTQTKTFEKPRKTK